MIVLREIRHFKRFFPNLPHFLLLVKKKNKKKKENSGLKSNHEKCCKTICKQKNPEYPVCLSIMRNIEKKGSGNNYLSPVHELED